MGRKKKYGERPVRIDALIPPTTAKEMEEYKKAQNMSWGDLIVELWDFYKVNKLLVISDGDNVP